MKNCINTLMLCFVPVMLWGQSASVSPSRFYYKITPGASGSQKLRVTNNGTKAETFQVTFADFSSTGNNGKTTIQAPGTNVNGCANWLTASPAFFEVAAGETKDVDIFLNVPSDPDANSVRWSVGIVKLAQERTGLNDKGQDVTGMQILQTFQFVFHIFQTPPSVEREKKADIINFVDATTSSDSVKVLAMEVQNTGKAIIDCAPYLDIVNVQNGQSLRVRNKAFTMLPGGQRAVSFSLPGDLEKGKYSILGVVDYGSNKDLAGAEIEIVIN